MKGNKSNAVSVAGEGRHLALWKLRAVDCVELASSSSVASCFAYCLLLALQSGIINNNLFFIFPLLMFVCSGLLLSLFKLEEMFGFKYFSVNVNQMSLLKWLAPTLYLFTPKSLVMLHRLGCCFVLPLWGFCLWLSWYESRSAGISCLPTVHPALGSVLGETEKCTSVSVLKHSYS